MSILQCDVWVLKRCLFRNVNIAKSCLVIETGACTLKKVGGGGGGWNKGLWQRRGFYIMNMRKYTFNFLMYRVGVQYMAAGILTNDNFVFVILFFDLGPGSEMVSDKGITVYW